MLHCGRLLGALLLLGIGVAESVPLLSLAAGAVGISAAVPLLTTSRWPLPVTMGLDLALLALAGWLLPGAGAPLIGGLMVLVGIYTLPLRPWSALGAGLGGAGVWMALALRDEIAPAQLVLAALALGGAGLLAAMGSRVHRMGAAALIAHTAYQQALAQQLSPQTIQRIDAGKLLLRSEVREVTVLAARLCALGDLCSGGEPQLALQELRRYLAILTEVIQGHAGTVLSQGGGELLALFNAPDHQGDHVRRALNAARAMQLEIRQHNIALRAAAQPTAALVVGMHTAAALVGPLGDAHPPRYTAIGDAPDGARHLQALGEAGEILISLAAARRARVRTRRTEQASPDALRFVRLITAYLNVTDGVDGE